LNIKWVYIFKHTTNILNKMRLTKCVTHFVKLKRVN
jgi:hypothetical protein